MRIIFVLGTSLVFENKHIDEISITGQVILIYFNDIELSKEYCHHLLSICEVICLFEIGIFFKNLQEESVYTLGDYTIHIHKINKKIKTTFSSYNTNLVLLDDFIKANFPMRSIFFQLQNTEININILANQIARFFWGFIAIYAITAIFFSYNFYEELIDFPRKKLIADMLLNK
jgi:hypothetical protein